MMVRSLRSVSVGGDPAQLLAREQAFFPPALLQTVQEPLGGVLQLPSLFGHHRIAEVSGLPLHPSGPAEQGAGVGRERIQSPEPGGAGDAEVRHRSHVVGPGGTAPSSESSSARLSGSTRRRRSPAPRSEPPPSPLYP